MRRCRIRCIRPKSRYTSKLARRGYGVGVRVRLNVSFDKDPEREMGHGLLSTTALESFWGLRCRERVRLFRRSSFACIAPLREIWCVVPRRNEETVLPKARARKVFLNGYKACLSESVSSGNRA